MLTTDRMASRIVSFLGYRYANHYTDYGEYLSNSVLTDR